MATKSRGPQIVVTPPLSVVRARLAGRRKEIANTTAPMKKASAFLDRWVQQNFRKEGGNVGGWRPFKIGGRWVSSGESRRFDSSAKLLQDTGRLRSSFLPFATRTNAGIGSDLPYAKAHEEGEGVPARRMLPRRGEVMADIRDILLQHVQKLTRRRVT